MTSLELHNLKRFYGSRKKKKRLGRGDGSGHGSYSTRGIKGQKARSGVSGLKRMGFRPNLRQLPKFKGQPRRYPSYEIVNIGQLNKAFEPGMIIDEKQLYRKRLVNNLGNGVKILGDGKLDKNFTIKAHAFSQKAKDAILKAGGKAIIK